MRPPAVRRGPAIIAKSILFCLRSIALRNRLFHRAPGRYSSGMATTRKTSRKKTPRKRAGARRRGPILRWLGWLAGAALVVVVVVVALHRVLQPPQGLYMSQEDRRLGHISRTWVPMDRIAPEMARAAVAAEDANFCLHWGFDMGAIRNAIADGGQRGASTITQQVVKNVYLWQGRSWPRKALEALMTPLVELLWPKRRILEVYLNVAEFGEGRFGIEAAARHDFGVSAAQLSATQAARLAAVLPDPKHRSARRPDKWLRERARDIRDGAATIRRDGRAACFED